ncbi:hypothetical protein [Alteriqipengyuania lutimaris]|uniref:Uncharacterized protein n=1 Tax=Alteriqipengyuania lutimaris TaxID=1538146 RepID=A0A395LHY7_9SPHN|nr:hypothetical protein [Alteriqipengyuania lutimaris]MBB3034599.1 uncharacterized membrane protein YhaH (DUF805 family) [Alteriqipengyuania lutimaris]RDS76523.1 hypothetical protein DL238_02170 [Alteriqipengyuania lutimaris]
MKSDATLGGEREVDWRAAISDNIAWALLVTTALLIFITMPKMKYAFEGITVYLLLVVMVGAFIPVLRFFEKRWRDLPDDRAHDVSLRGAFRRDQVALWLLTAGVPLLLAAGFGMAFGGK